MVSWSCLGRVVGLNILKNQSRNVLINQNLKFSMTTALKSGDHGPRTMALQPSRWQWHKFKDMFHYYLMVGLIPCCLVIFYTNVFIGPAQLQEIPEGYVPKYWEYHRHPITRFIARYVHNSPQQDYEKFMHFIEEEYEKSQLIALEKQIKDKMADRADYQSYYYRPVVNKYLRHYKKIGEEMQERLGDDV